jgi:hypothetical protein
MGGGQWSTLNENQQNKCFKWGNGDWIKEPKVNNGFILKNALPIHP